MLHICLVYMTHIYSKVVCSVYNRCVWYVYKVCVYCVHSPSPDPISLCQMVEQLVNRLFRLLPVPFLPAFTV